MCYCPRDADDQTALVDVVIPSLGDAVTTAVLLAWWVELGDRVSVGDVLFEVGTEKTVCEISTLVDGTLAEVLAPNQSSVVPGMTVGRIRTS